MNFNDRDNITLIYYQIFIKNYDTQRINIDFDRLKTLYNDSTTLAKYKIIINDILQVSLSDWKKNKFELSNNNILDEVHENMENSFSELVRKVDLNSTFLDNFNDLRAIVISLGKKESIEYKELVKVNDLIKSLILQAVSEDKPELEFIILRNLILIIAKFGIFNKAEKTGLVNIDFKFFLGTSKSAKNNELCSQYSYIVDSRLEIIYLLLKDNYSLFKHNTALLFKLLISQNRKRPENILIEPSELRVKLLKLITNLILENKVFISETFFEKSLLGSFIKLIPDIDFDVNDSFNKELVNSIRLLLENYYPTFNYISNKDYFPNLLRLLEISTEKEGKIFDDTMNMNLLKLLIIIGLDLKKYSFTRVLVLFEREHLSKLKSSTNLSNDYKNLIIKTLFYTHKIQFVENKDNNALLSAYNNIENKNDLKDCPSPINYCIESSLYIKNNIKLSTYDLGKINSVYLRNSTEMGFKESGKALNSSYNCVELFVTKVPKSEKNLDEVANGFKMDDIENELDGLKMEFGHLATNNGSLNLGETTYLSSDTRKSSLSLSLPKKLKKKSIFGVKI